MIELREIRPTDFEPISKLSAELGYQIEPEILRKQIILISENPNHTAFVALETSPDDPVGRDEKLVGYMHAFQTFRLTSEPFVEIGGLVVSQNHRRKGIGKMLVEKVENWATASPQARGKIKVRCQAKRLEAHQFYLSLNFLEKKEQKVFEKKGW